MNWLTYLLFLVELYVGKPATMHQWQERWLCRHDLPHVTEIASLPTKKVADKVGDQWEERVKYLREGKCLWEHTPDAHRYERAVAFGRKQIELWRTVQALRRGLTIDGFGNWHWGDSWEKRLTLDDLYRSLKEGLP